MLSRTAALFRPPLVSMVLSAAADTAFPLAPPSCFGTADAVSVTVAFTIFVFPAPASDIPDFPRCSVGAAGEDP
jgi:hypothetical protein